MAFPLHMFVKRGVGRKHKQITSVKAEGLKGTWTSAQGRFVGAELRVQVEETEMLVAHSFVVEVFSFLCHMAARLRG